MALQIKFLANQISEIAATINRFLHSATDATFLVAYGTHRAFAKLEQNAVLSGYLKTGSRLRVLFDADRHFTDPQLIIELSTSPGDVECRLYAPRIRQPDRQGPIPAFHPKVYYFEKEEWAAAVVGSSNFSPGGLFHNYEAAIAVEGEWEDEFFEQIRAYAESVWDSNFQIEVLSNSRFVEQYSDAYRSAQQRQPRPGLTEEAPFYQTTEDTEFLQQAFQKVTQESLQPIVAYTLGLIAGGGLHYDVENGKVSIQMRRGPLNRGKPNEGLISFPGVSERSLSQRDCVRRDAERVMTRLRNAFTDLETGDEASLEQTSELIFRINLAFKPQSPIWERVSRELPASGAGKYVWPTELPLEEEPVRRAYLQGYMDIRTRISVHDRIPAGLLRIAVSVGGKADEFAEKLLGLMAAEFACEPGRFNLEVGSKRGKETLIRIDPRLVPPNFLQSHWQRLVVEDFRSFNEQMQV